MQVSTVLLPALTAVPMIEQLSHEKDNARPIRSGVRLPSKDTPIPYTANDLEQIDDDTSPGQKTYLEYMLLGCYPEGPFFDVPESSSKHKEIDCLISKLIENRQFTALNELLQECDPLYYLNIQPHSFSPATFSHFLQTVSQAQSCLRKLMFVVPMSIGLPTSFSEKSEMISDFILRNPKLEKFIIVGVDNGFSPKILEAIATVGNARSIDFYFQYNQSDALGENLRQTLSRCNNLHSVCLKQLRMSEKKSAEIFSALRNCRQLTEIYLHKWEFGAIETCQELRLLIQESTTLESFKCADWFSSAANIQEVTNAERFKTFNLGIGANRSLKSLSLGPLFPLRNNDHIAPLFHALQAQATIQSLEFDSFDFIDIDAEHIVDGLELLADLVDNNQRITQIKGLDTSQVDRPVEQYPLLSPVAKRCAIAARLLKDRLARNSAIASGNLTKIFSQAFFPSPGAPMGSNHIGDPGLHLTEHILRLSPDVPSFEKGMVEIALTVDETAKHEQTGTLEIKHPGLPGSSSA